MKTYGKILFLLLLCFSVKGFAQVPVMNSYPTASATVFLDFDGHYVNGTSWNMVGPFYCGPSNLSTAQITEIFHRVSEDYRPFNINITTDSTKYWSAPAATRMRIILTVTSDWYGPAGGVSYMGSFTWGDNTPGFVFTELLGYNAKQVAEAASHEVGHTLGLRHQSAYDAGCNKTSEYNYGTGSGEIGWAPIMGAGYYRNFTLWNNGANPYGCTSYQNDLSIITTNNGFTYRTDDFSDNATGNATTLTFTNNQFNVSGVIERSTDIDAFKFIMPYNGAFKLNAVPFNIGGGNSGSNLDLQVELIKQNTVIGTYNPATLLDAVIDTTLGSGTYFIRVAGKGNAYAPEYASLGSYSLSAVISTGGGSTLAVRKLELQGHKENGRSLLGWVVDADDAIAIQSLEVSANGNDFYPVAQLSPAARNYTDAAVQGGRNFYRLKVGFANGKQQYSNTLNLLAVHEVRPELATNTVRTALTVNSPAAFDYLVTDYSGRLLSRGRLVEGRNTVPTQMLNSGMYLISFNNGREQYTERFIKP